MGRIRTIKPEFFTSLTIDKLSLSAQRTFIGLWVYADDHGRGLDDTRLIKSALWPLRSRHSVARVERDMSDIAALGLIRRYTHGSRNYFQILGWTEHQRVSHPSDSRIPLPPPPEGSGIIREGSGDFRAGKEQGRELGNGKEEIHAPLPKPNTKMLDGKLHSFVDGLWVPEEVSA